MKSSECKTGAADSARRFPLNLRDEQTFRCIYLGLAPVPMIRSWLLVRCRTRDPSVLTVATPFVCTPPDGSSCNDSRRFLIQGGSRGEVEARYEGMGEREDTKLGVGKDEGASVMGLRRGQAHEFPWRAGNWSSTVWLLEPETLQFMLQPACTSNEELSVAQGQIVTVGYKGSCCWDA